MSHTTPLTRIEREIRAEQAAQIAKFGEQNHPDGTFPDASWTFIGPAHRVAEDARAECQHLAAKGVVTWRAILLEEVAEAFTEEDPARLREELIQIGAVVQTWIAAIDRRETGGMP